MPFPPASDLPAPEIDPEFPASPALASRLFTTEPHDLRESGCQTEDGRTGVHWGIKHAPPWGRIGLLQVGTYW